jgi:DNA-binding MarR family transcriptional regulator
MLPKTTSITAPQLSTEEEHTLQHILAAIELFQSEDKRDVPLNMLRMFLIAALNQGVGTVELAHKARVPVSVASRYLMDLAERNRYREDGHFLVEQTIDVMNRRQRPVRLTPEGKARVNQLVRIFGAN